MPKATRPSRTSRPAARRTAGVGVAGNGNVKANIKPKRRRGKPPNTAHQSAPVSTATAPFPIVGIGASAGGLEALEHFLSHVPKNSGMAFVIVQHLDPTRKGHHARTAPARHRHEGDPGQGSHPGAAELRLCDPAEQGHVHPAWGAAPARTGVAARTAPADRFFPPLPGAGPAGTEHRRHPFGHGLGRHAGAAGDQGKGGRGVGAGPGDGQIRRHAAQRD